MESTSLKPSPSSSSLSSSSYSFSKLKSSSTKHKTCPICLSNLPKHHLAIISNCFHSYCLSCLVHWTNYKHTCPLCNSPFSSYFTSFSPNSFKKNHLRPPLDPPRSRRQRGILSSTEIQRVLQRTREEVNTANWRSRPVPRQRSFVRGGSVPSEVVAERILQWRASIYKLGLKAVPFTGRNLSNLNVTDTGHKEIVLHRIEPWIRRELQAILEDPDPTIIIHVVTSLYISRMEKKLGSSLSCPGTDATFLAPLQPFLSEWTTTFWHELRCFAESSFGMDTYDEVVEYRKST